MKFKCGFICQECLKPFNVYHLNTHHKTYIHHGEEIDHLEDLIVLCQECHEKEHGK